MAISRVTDEAVEAFRDWLDCGLDDDEAEFVGRVRNGLEAAEPHMAPFLPTQQRIADELEKHGVLLFVPQPQCCCGHIYESLPSGGVAWAMQNQHRADAVLSLLNGGSS